ncbi:sensor histidine kinase [Nocardia inohanensis]|uniref:sensor histidine kinase n=1 Tax=Nocardia inohanensis TaxID=209246 RepID=UPI000AFB97C8|nr:nitrate- and nitrite sensing domain-containing protein [Nocardia inohanensis]
MTIVLVTSVVLLAVGVGGAAYLVKTGRDAQNWAALASRILDPAAAMVQAFQDERLHSLRYLAGDADAVTDLSAARGRTDTAIAQVRVLLDVGREIDRDGSAAEISGYRELYEKFPALRGSIDARQTTQEQTFTLFGTVIDSAFAAAMMAARVAPDAAIAVQLSYAVAPLRAAEALARATALGSVMLARDGADGHRMTEFGDYVGEYRREAAYAASVLRGPRLDQLRGITTGSDWRLLSDRADGLRSGDSLTAAEAARWQAAGGRVGSALMRLWQDQSRDAHVLADAHGERIATRSLYVGAAMLLVSISAFLIALGMANRVVARMRRLQAHTLELADERLPDLMRRLAAGEAVDPDREIAGPDFGTDEFGQVASAFGRAQLAAISAAVAEAKTRAGVNAVFLNIAHRSQIVVHRQLALIDQAERTEEHPGQLDLLFQLDHLATRARRNAENLIILGGSQPGRRWRKPVPLTDVVRGAVAESLDYTRIRTARLPDLHISGNAVADLIHTLAELMDNATGFSPPHAQVSVSGAVVGRGVAIEIEDQGLGMSPSELLERNDLLAHPPDFSVAALTDDIRLGLFVVAKLAAKHGISVRLRESAYGGVQAVLLIPATLLTDFGGQANDSDIPAARIRTPDNAGSHDDSFRPSEHRPELPQRARRSGPVPPESEPEPPRGRSADEARDRIAAVMDATRKARRRPDR